MVERLGLGQGRIPQHSRNDPLGQIIRALKTPTLAYRDLARRPQMGQDFAGDLDIPPSAAVGSVEIGAAQGAFIAKTSANEFGGLGVASSHVAPPRMVGVFLSAEVEHGVELHRQPRRLVAPVFEERGAGAKQFLGARGVEALEPRMKHDRVAPGARDRYGIELQVPQPQNRLE